MNQLDIVSRQAIQLGFGFIVFGLLIIGGAVLVLILKEFGIYS